MSTEKLVVDENADWDIGSDYPQHQQAASNQAQSAQNSAYNQPAKPTVEDVKAQYKTFLHGIRYAFLVTKVANTLGLITDEQAFEAVKIAVDRVQAVIDAAIGEDDTDPVKFLRDVTDLAKLIKADDL